MVVNINNNNSKEDLEQLLRNKDNDLFANYSKERYQLISKRWKWILYLNQWLHVKRRYYYDKDKKENVYLLDESLGIKKYQHIKLGICIWTISKKERIIVKCQNNWHKTNEWNCFKFMKHQIYKVCETN